MMRTKRHVVLLVAMLIVCIGCGGKNESAKGETQTGQNTSVQEGDVGKETIMQDEATPIEDFEYGYNGELKGVTINSYNGTSMKVIIPREIEGEPVVEIGGKAFKESEIMSISFPDTVRVISTQAFCNCRGLTELTLPESLQIIGHGAFSNCDNLTEVVIPDSVCEIGGEAFYYCASLKNVVLPKNLELIGKMAFCDTGIEEITFPDNAKSIIIGPYAFGCESLSSIIWSDSVVEIGEGAFDNCTSLEVVEIPNSVSKVGRYAFSYCANLRQVVLSTSMTEISEYMFRDCEKLETVTIPDGIIKIHSGAFEGCDKLDEQTRGEIQKRAGH